MCIFFKEPHMSSKFGLSYGVHGLDFKVCMWPIFEDYCYEVT